MAPPGRGDWRTGGFDLAATQPASPDEKIGSKDAPKAASKLREPRLHMRGLLAKRGSALLDPQRRKPTSDARLVFRNAEEVQPEEGKPAPFDTRSLTHAMTRDPASNTWRTVGGGAKDPGVREQAGSLLRAFEVAMDAVEKASINEAASVDEPDGQKLAANILGEMIAAKHDVAQAFSKRTSLEASLDQEGKLNWTKEQKDISRLWCEAKWTDVLSQKLADLLQEQTREHGALLHKLRLKRAAMLDKALRLHSDALWRHDRACALMEKKGDALMEASRKHDAVVEAKNEEIASLKERIAELERNRDADRALFERQAEAKVKRSRDALEAMKELFLDMGKDKTDLAKMDARDDVQRMRRELAESMKELQELRLLRDGAQMDRAEVARARRELKAQRTATAAHTRELDARADRVNELMMARAELEHYVTTDRQKREEAKTLKGGPREEGQVLDFKPPDCVEDAAQEASLQIEPSQALCVRCQRSMDALEEEKRGKAHDHKKRVRCLGYRALLPQLPASMELPSRSHAWGQVCMRTILIAKLNHDRLHRDESLVTRFPEFVHAWFSSQAVVELTDKERNSMVARELGMAQKVEVSQEMDPDDVDRWAFYFKIKELAALDSIEAKMFWLLLDETHGDDYGCFFLHSFQALVACCGTTLGGQLGIAARGLSYHQTCLLAAEADSTLKKKGVPGTDLKRYDRADLVKALDSLSTMGGAVFVYVAQAYAVLDAVLAGPLQSRLPLIRKAVHGLSQPCATNKLACFDDAAKLPAATSPVWLLFGPAPTDPKKLPEHCLKYKVDKDSIKRGCDLFSLIQVLAHVFKEEQATRAAAVRVMFGAVADKSFASLTADSERAVAKTQDMLARDKDLAYARLPRNLTLSFDTFASITRALWPKCSQVEAAAMYRAAFDQAHGRVDHAAFEAVMARHRVFTRCLNLPRFEGCGFANALADSLSTSLTTVVTRRLHFSEPLLDRIRAALPQPAAKRFSDLIQHLRRELGSASPTRGVRALCAYREVLRRALALRSLKLEVASSSEFLAGPDRYAGLRADAELGRLEEALRAHDIVGEGDGTGASPADIAARLALSEKFLRFRQSVAVRKIQATLRARAERSLGPPPAVLNAMRRLAGRGRGGVHRRAVTRDAAWTAARVAQIYDWVRDADGEAPFGDVVYRYCLDAWGAPSLADRAAHDLYYNVRRHAPTSRRCLLFAAFSGIDNDPISKMGHRVGSSRLLFEAATAPAARRFFFHCVDLLRDDGPAFPSDDEERWLVPKAAVEGAARAAFNRDAAPCYAPPATDPPRKGRIEAAKAFDDLLFRLRDLAIDEDGRVDADAVLWLLLQHWRELVLDGRELSSTKAIAAMLNGVASYNNQEMVEEAEEVARKALLSLDHFVALRRRLGVWGLVYDEAADVASYHAAVAHVERTPAPSPVKAVMLGLRRYHIRTLRGAAPRSAEDGARARRAVAANWAQYEAVVRDHVTQITKAMKKADAVHSGVPLFFVSRSLTPSDAQVRRREALKKKETSQDDLEPDPARERIQNLKGLLAKLDAAVDLLQGGARDPEDDAAPWSGLSFGYEASDFVDAFRAVARAPASDEALGRAARAVGREVRCLLAHVYETQVDAADESSPPPEFVRDAWA